MKKSVSFIVPVYNGEKTLRDCLESILTQDISTPFEVIVVDNASTDRTLEIVNAYPQLKVVRMPGTRNRGRARNQGAREANFPILAFIDCDVTLSKDWASSLIQALKVPFAAAQTTILTRYKKKDEENYYLTPTSTFQTMDSCSLLIFKNVFLDVGGFEETLSRWEDTHLTMKLLGQGHGLLVMAPPKATKHESRNLFQRYKRLFESGQSEGVALRAWFPEDAISSKGFLNLRHHPSPFQALIQRLGQIHAKTKVFPPLKYQQGWTYINERLALSKKLNVLIAPKFICIKSLSNNFVYTIYEKDAFFDIIQTQAAMGEDFWDDLLVNCPEDLLILRRNMNEK